jgi:hypothetical protein|tara:strand:+ start:69 stop:308 length:240 start_codon:yes stop_codon:yes gene_type:complete
MTDVIGLANAVGVPMLLALGWLYYLINKRVKEVEQSLNSHKLFAAEHYVTAMVIEKMEARIGEQFNRLYARLDQLQQTE